MVEFVWTDVQHMSPEAAGAAKDVAKYQHAVPARNRTYQVAIGAASVVAISWMAISALKGSPDALGKVLIAAIVAIGGVFAVKIYRAQKKKD